MVSVDRSGLRFDKYASTANLRTWFKRHIWSASRLQFRLHVSTWQFSALARIACNKGFCADAVRSEQ
jgi:hypothetical protein